MAITASLLGITLRWAYMGQQMQTRRYFEPEGAAFLNVDAIHVGEAYWNHVKEAWRAIVPVGLTTVFSSVLVEEIGGSQGFAEDAVPTGERGGTRSGSLDGYMPPYTAAGIRFTVATRATRPGQMRVPFVFEIDNNDGLIASGFKTLVTNLANVYAAPIVLGAPVATGTLYHRIVRRAPGDPNTIVASQRVTGMVVANNLTTQNSRKFGRGA